MTFSKSETAAKWALVIHFVWYVVANLAQIVVWWFVTPDQFFWPVWSIVAWSIGLAFHFWAVRRFLSTSHNSWQLRPGR
ncbi:2TM domain-containing protein [Micromonospora sp. NPDC049801]|uniref:2TM domain-containing protein n=1 Tax=unclassified Micromonospora TaxID=2617518 RepID=UPI0033F0B2D3